MVGRPSGSILKTMKQLEVISKMERVFGNRKLRNHAGERGVIKYGDSGDMTAIVLDLSVSKQILQSKSFESFNYFSDGYRRFSDAKYSLESVRRFFVDGPLFLEGERQRSVKQKFNDLMKDQENELIRIMPRIKELMKNRKHRLHTALDFSRLFVDICLATIIENLLSIPLKAALGALRARRNVFYFHFHPLRHRDANEALAMLEKYLPPAGRNPAPDKKLLLCHSLIMMAYDPLVATICASLVEGRAGDRGASADRYCPVSFVSRICVNPVDIGEASFNSGDVCYVSLVPAIDEKTANAFPFGAGVHICIGKRISLQIVRLAEEIIAAEFKEGFDQKPVFSPDGAFLSFQN